MPVGHLYVFFGKKVYFRYSVHFLKPSYFSVVELYEFFIYFVYLHLIIRTFTSIFSHLVGNLLILLMISFVAISLAWGDISRQGLLRSKSNSVLPIFYSRSFMVSGLSFKSLIHFELILGYRVRERVISPISMLAVPNTIYWRNNPFLIVCSLLFCYKLIDFICVSLCLGSQFHSIDLCMFFCKYHVVLIAIVCKQSVESESVVSPALSFFSGLLWLFQVFCGSI